MKNDSNKQALNLSLIDKAYLAIDFRNKTWFLDKKGFDVTNMYLTYQEADMIVDMALNEKLP